MADPTTQSNYLDITTEHIQFEWNVDFDSCTISGSAYHTLKVQKDGVDKLVLDTSDLVIRSVQVSGQESSYEVGPKHPVMGSALHIPLSAGLKTGESVQVKITYHTTEGSTALQWLDKEQTQGKKFPYLFSQCQPIYARAVVPVQDTPSAKIKYSASVNARLPVLLSAIRISPPSDGPPHDGKEVGKDIVTYKYDQPVPIPSYLIAIACGNVVYRPLPKPEGKKWTTGVWAEPELIDQAYWEFSEDTAKFLATEEDIVTSYKFGVYDLLVLPPSFPYGGMENACLSFLTPTLLTGDRTLVDVVVHELTHSYFGNGVTHAHASHFWLNEGWTTYMERLLQQVLHTPAHRDFSYIIGYKALTDSLKEYKDRPKYQRLIINFEKGEDPDDAYSSVPYEKGANFILHLERTLGGLEVFLPYVKEYVNTFLGKSITTEQWKAHLFKYFGENGGADKIKALEGVNWDAWFYGEGLELPVHMEYDASLAKQAYDLAERWNASRSTPIPDLKFKKDDLNGLDANQIIVFLERLQTFPALPSNLITHLGDIYQLSSTGNAELRLRFHEVALADPSSSAAKTFAVDAAKWVVGDDGTGVVKGRMKFCRPVLRATNKVDHNLAVATLTKHKLFFHPIARRLMEKDLGIH